MDIPDLHGRLRALEDAVLGTPVQPGLAEVQRTNAREIAGLKKSLSDLSGGVDALVAAQRRENDIREGEQKALRTFRNIAYLLLLALGAGGSLLGSRILSVLEAIKP